MSRGALQKLQRRSSYEKRSKLVLCTKSKKGSENLSSRFEPKISWIVFSEGSGPPLTNAVPLSQMQFLFHKCSSSFTNVVPLSQMQFASKPSENSWFLFSQQLLDPPRKPGKMEMAYLGLEMKERKTTCRSRFVIYHHNYPYFMCTSFLKAALMNMVPFFTVNKSK